jgi:NitT/TauT family transport system substrate-binding protein
MKNIKIIGGLLLAVVIVYLAFFSGKNDEVPEVSSELSSVSIAVNPWIGSGIYYVAEEKGLFEKYGVEVSLTDFLDGAIGKQLMASGRVDAMASLTPETMVLLADAGVEAKVVAITDLSTGADGIISDSSINSLEDLRGKKVAFESGSPSQFFLEYLLKEKGMSSKDLKVVDVPSPDAGAAFVSGSVDAAVTWEPWLSQSSDREGGKILVNSKDVPILPGMLIARNSAIQEKSVELSLVVAALFEAADWINNNQDEAADIMARRFDIAKQDVVDQYPTFRFVSLKENQKSFSGKGDIDVYNLIDTASVIWSDLGFLSGNNQIDSSVLATGEIVKNLK